MSYLLDYNPGTQQYAYPRRGAYGYLSGTCIIHTAECAMDLEGDDSSAENCAHFIANRADYGSYHRLVDSDSIIDMLPWEYEAWQDSETNNWAVGISAALSAGRWNEVPEDRRDRFYINMAICAAEFVQYMASKGVEVPVRRITGAEARARVPGFCAHGDSGISRSDPGIQFDWDKFFAYTNLALAGNLSEIEEDMGTLEAITPTAMDNLRVMVAGVVKTETANIQKSVAFQEGFAVKMFSLLSQQLDAVAAKVAAETGVVIDTTAIATEIRTKLSAQIGGTTSG